ncbi:hypothetical protein BKA82DRAFT_963752 [Pisolithus tinctorius]|uniref:DUF1014-domain-containing protein n=1 Tax=Pisolithus tinctorius Marx 270 TaxID=870435 RepID=A0A0C3NXR8_PISTI|nr:hypothetical protein BKA82DRAFT_963752 [Pisolithus tinctorius]KIO00136.1 hypothetical protein M404DRAFT_963752 [Pisolithus tinctorius Marx 270]
MAPKSTNAKKEAGRAKKAENEAKKQQAAAADKERKEAENWAEGAKTGKSKEDKEEKRRAELARKAENARLLAEEESSLPSKVKSAPKAGTKKTAKGVKPAGPGAIAAGGGLVSGKDKERETEQGEAETYAATGIDNALDLLEIVTAKMDKASVGQQAAGIERHPERRFKVISFQLIGSVQINPACLQAAFEAYKEAELPKVKEDHPGLRLQQYHDILYKQFQKSPENPFNQVTVAYDASKEERVQALKEKQEAVQKRLRA